MNEIQDQCVKTGKNILNNFHSLIIIIIIINIFNDNWLAFKRVTVVTNRRKGNLIKSEKPVRKGMTFL